MVDWLKFVGPPGSPGLAILGLCVTLFLARVWPRRPVIAAAWLSAFAGLHLLLAVPAVAFEISRLLPRYQPVERTPRVDTLYVLGGDNSTGRIREVLRMYRTHPRVSVIALAEPWFVERLVRSGIPRDRVRMVMEPTTTREQLEWVEAHLQSQGRRSSALLASRLHMTRVAALVQAMGIETVLLPSSLDVEPAAEPVWRWVPSLAALRMSGEVLYERVALGYYERRGWVGTKRDAR